jgi:outer membrane protein TolC
LGQKSHAYSLFLKIITEIEEYFWQRMVRNLFLIAVAIVFVTINGFSQPSQHDSLPNATLPACIQYAFKHQPIIQQSLIDERIVDATIRTKLADWYPQINFAGYYQYNIKLPTNLFNGNYITTGTSNIASIGLSGTQNLFNRDVLLASRSAKDIRKSASQMTDSARINIIVNVSKAFYDVLLTEKQESLLDEDIARLGRTLQDAYNQYRGGIVDKTDYKRATISLNNAKAQRKRAQDLLTAKYFYLRQLMGYPDSLQLELHYDSVALEREIVFDTTQEINYNNRIEFRLLETEKTLQQYNLKYYKWGYLPSAYVYGSYNFGYFNSDFNKLYERAFPNSYVGLQLNFPIFQGTKRTYEVKAAKLEVERLDWAEVALENSIRTEYADALAGYKGGLANYNALKENVQLAKEVYDVIRLQYQQGIKTYLDVIVAESDLRTAELNLFTALYTLLESKIDAEKALGILQ